MPADFLPILLLIVIACFFAVVALFLPTLLGPHKPSDVKLATYESGKLPIGKPRHHMHVQYYRTAMLFILFDVEIIFFYPWAVILRQLKIFGLIEMAIFVVILLVGYIYVWRKGALEWD